MRNLILISIATIFLGMEIPAARASSAYTCEIFGYGSPTASTVATGINNNAQVVGYYTEQGSQIVHAFLRDPAGTITPLKSPSGDDNFGPIAINNFGQILGPSFILNPDGTFITIDQPQAPPGHTYFPYQLSGLNDKGEVGGSFQRDFNSNQIGTTDFFVREPDGAYRIVDELSTASTGPFWTAGALNNSGFLLRQNPAFDAVLLESSSQKVPLMYPGRSGRSAGWTLNNNNFTAASLLQSSIAFLRTPDAHYPSIVCPDAINSMLNISALNDNNLLTGSIVQAGRRVAFLATPTALAPALQLSNTNWTFSPQLVGSLGGSGRIYISNTGPADFHTQAIWLGGTGQSTDQLSSFRITGTNCVGSIPPGGSCSLDFSFGPQAPGWQTAAIYIPDESTQSPHIILLGGTGIGSTLQLSNTSWDFGAHHVGDVTGNGIIYIYNPGPALVAFRFINIAGSVSEFHLTGNTCGGQLAPYKSCGLSFNFTPIATGERTATINLTDNSNYGPVLIPLMGWVY